MGKIIFVDDTEYLRITFSDILTHANYEIIGTTINRKEANQLFKKTTPDLVIKDITMPGMHGLGEVKAIMTLNDNIHMIICSAMDKQKIVVETIEWGAKDFIIKLFPFHEACVIKTEKHVLSMQHQTMDVL